MQATKGSPDIRCEQCPTGRFSTDAFRGTGCISCDAGWSAWPTGPGAFTCILNSSTLFPEITSHLVTTVSEATTTSSHTAPPVTCDAGEHVVLQYAEGQSPGGSLNFDAGAPRASVCQDCPLGRFQPLNGVTNVYECARWADPRPCSSGSSVQFGTSTSDASCTQCGAGRFSTSIESFDEDTLVAMQGAGWETSSSTR